MEHWRGQPRSARTFISHQNPTVLEKTGMLAVSRQLSRKTMMRMFLLGKLTATLMVSFHFFLIMCGSFTDEMTLIRHANR